MTTLTRFTALSVALAMPLAFGVIDAAAAQQAPMQQQAAQQRALTDEQVPDRIMVTSANELVGRVLVDSQGEEAGEIRYIMIDAQSGEVQYALVGSRGALDLGQQFAAVPWPLLNVPIAGEQPIRLDVTLSRIKEAPRFDRQRLAELTQPQMVARVYDYYATPTGQGQAQQGGGEQDQAGRQPQGQVGRQQQQAERNQQQAQQGQQQGRPQILVGRQIVTMLAPPMFTSADQLRGTEVSTTGGRPVGVIDKLMIDTERGHVAYMLVSHGGYLGMEEQWLPVPFQAVAWSPETASYQIAASPSQLQTMPMLKVAELPTWVHGEQLADLYQRFDAEPYWLTADVGRAALGVQVQPVSERLAQAVQLEDARGALVAHVMEGSPAANAGIQPGDVILSVNGAELRDATQLVRLIANAEVGSTADLVVWRDGSKQELQATLQPRQPIATAGGPSRPAGQQQAQPSAGEPPTLGLTLTALTPEMRQYLDLSDVESGAVVVDLDVGSIAAESGLQPGDVIVQVGDQPVSSPTDVAEQVQEVHRQGDGMILMRVNRGGNYRYIALTT